MPSPPALRPGSHILPLRDDHARKSQYLYSWFAGAISFRRSTGVTRAVTAHIVDHQSTIIPRAPVFFSTTILRTRLSRGILAGCYHGFPPELLPARDVADKMFLRSITTNAAHSHFPNTLRCIFSNTLKEVRPEVLSERTPLAKALAPIVHMVWWILGVSLEIDAHRSLLVSVLVAKREKRETCMHCHISPPRLLLASTNDPNAKNTPGYVLGRSSPR